MLKQTSESAPGSPVPAALWAALALMAGGAYTLGGERIPFPTLPVEGGLARAVALEAARRPELLAGLALLAAWTWALGGHAVARPGPATLRRAGLLLGLLLAAVGASTLATLPRPVSRDWWLTSSGMYSFAEPRVLLALGVTSVAVAVALLAAAQLRARAMFAHPAGAIAVAWLAAALRSWPLVWLVKDDAQRWVRIADRAQTVLLTLAAGGLLVALVLRRRPTVS